VTFTVLSPTSAAMAPISRMFSCTQEARALFQKPRDLIEIVVCRHECCSLGCRDADHIFSKVAGHKVGTKLSMEYNVN
jgi:hypothetical protein